MIKFLNRLAGLRPKKKPPCGGGEITAEQPFQAQLIRYLAWRNEQTRKAVAGEPVYGDAAPLCPKPQPTDTSSLVEMVSDAIAHEPWETEPQAAVLAVAKWLRSRGNCGSASELEREATK